MHAFPFLRPIYIAITALLVFIFPLGAQTPTPDPAPSPASAPATPLQLDATATAFPDGWVPGKEGATTRELEDGTPFLRLVAVAPRQMVELTSAAPIVPGTRGLAYEARFRTANVKFGSGFTSDARTLFEFLDAEGAPVKPAPGAVVFDSHAHDWAALRRTFLVPDGAVRLRVTFCLNKPASGTLDVAEARVVPLSADEVEAIVQAPAVAAKKEADDQAEVERLLTLPPKSVELKVEGNKIVTAEGTVFRLQGVNVESLEWVAKGENVLRTAKTAFVDWNANVIRLPVSDDFWFGRGRAPQSTSNDPEAYRQLIDNVVRLAAGQGGHVVLDLHRYHAPTDNYVAFWKDAAARYKNNPAVLFDLMNEPGGISWDIWRFGGDVVDKPKNGGDAVTYHSPGMQGLLDAVRSTGAKNIVLAGGLGNAYDLSGIAQGYALEDKTGNGIVYSVHFYNWHKNWEKHFLFLADQYPLFVGETGADIKKMPFVPANQQEDPATWVPDALGMIDKYGLSWTAFSLHPKSTPVLISDWNYTPTAFWGAYVKDALHGKDFPFGALR